VTSTTNVSLNLVQLYKALGGGWERVFPEFVGRQDRGLSVAGFGSARAI
jgi:hypothetical protein